MGKRLLNERMDGIGHFLCGQIEGEKTVSNLLVLDQMLLFRAYGISNICGIEVTAYIVSVIK